MLKAANEYTKEKNYIPFDEFKKMPKVQRALLWHAAQATLYNLLVQFATAEFKYIYNKSNKAAKKAAAKKAAKSAKKAAAKKAAKRKAKAKAADISSTSDGDGWMGNMYDCRQTPAASQTAATPLTASAKRRSQRPQIPWYLDQRVRFWSNLDAAAQRR